MEHVDQDGVAVDVEKANLRDFKGTKKYEFYGEIFMKVKCT